jgi:hypothetical protein
MMNNKGYVIAPCTRALNDYDANLPESVRAKQKKPPWYETEKKTAYSMMVSSAMDPKQKSENF